MLWINGPGLGPDVPNKGTGFDSLTLRHSITLAQSH